MNMVVEVDPTHNHTPSRFDHYNNVIMGAIASQITSLAIVYSVVYWGADQRQHQSYASLAFVRGIHWGPVNSPHKWPVTRKIFPFDNVIMESVSGQPENVFLFEATSSLDHIRISLNDVHCQCPPIWRWLHAQSKLPKWFSTIYFRALKKIHSRSPVLWSKLWWWLCIGYTKLSPNF